jgi:hypothetical protein
MRQVMPHRNNIELRRTKSKWYFFHPVEKPGSAALDRNAERVAPCAFLCEEWLQQQEFNMIFADPAAAL